MAVLKLGGNAMGDDGVIRLGEALRQCATLRQLDLSGNRLGGAGLEAILEAVRVSGGGLERLELRENNIRAEAAMVVRCDPLFVRAHGV